MSNKNMFKTRQLTVIGLLSAISIVLGLTGYGFIPLPIAKATIMHIPVIIGAILEGPIVGVAIGLIFGVFSIIQNIMSPNLLSFAYMNPLVSVLPRVLIGVTSYYAYTLIKAKNQSIKIGISAVVGTLTNTFGVLTMIYVLYAARYATAKHISAKAAAATIYGVAVTNGTCEAVISVLITIPVVLAVKKIIKR
ncbi:membrane protein [Clostridium acetobutylicum]|nr:membrane protein [Clostridium acetobutylicum]